MLDCGHTFHLRCLEAQIKNRWPGVKISFAHLTCSLCRAELQIKNDKKGPNRHWASTRLQKILKPHLKMKGEVHQLLVQAAQEEGFLKDIHACSHNKRVEVAMEKMAAFMCAECKKPFCGGRADCAQEAKLDASKMQCGVCAWKDTESPYKCEKHGVEYAVFKCDCCCQPATYDCSGNHYCEKCHTFFDRNASRPTCQGREEDKCPLGVVHPPNQPRNHNIKKVGYVIGCTKCLGIDAHCNMDAVSQQTRARYKKKGVLES